MDKATYWKIRKELDLRPDGWALIRHFAIDFGLLALCVLASQAPSWLSGQFVCIPLISIWMFRGFSLMHDAVHRAVSKNRLTNDLVGIVAGVFCLLPYEPWKVIHLEHHHWSGNIEKDPVMALVRSFEKWPKAFRVSSTLLWKVWMPVLAIFQYGVFWFFCVKTLLSRKPVPISVASIVSPLLVWTALFALLPVQVGLSLLLPGVVLYLIAVEVVNFPHHLGLEYSEGETKWSVWDQHRTARTCLYPRWMARWVVLNFNYHIEHHMFPDVPWYHLDKIHMAVRPLLGHQYNTDPQFEWIQVNRKRSLDQILQRGNGNRKSSAAA